MSGHPCHSGDGRCLRCGKPGYTGGCGVCPHPMYSASVVVLAPITVVQAPVVVVPVPIHWDINYTG